MSLFHQAPTPLYDDHTQNVLSDRSCLFDTSVDNFGLFSFTVAKFPETTDELVFLFTVDQSASMSDVCSDGRTKMHHVTHTLKNMLLFLRGCNVKASVYIAGFDHDVHPIVELTHVTPTSVMEMIGAIDTHLYPKGGTDIGRALTKTSRLMTQLRDDNDTSRTRMYHIFMTDGEVTNGVCNNDSLVEMVAPGFHHAFLGFGINHDFTLLTRLGNATEMCAYHFIDKLENAGMVYGEILHAILYNVLSDVRVLVSGPAEVYDCRTNTWTQELYIGEVASGMTKTFHLRTWKDTADQEEQEDHEKEETKEAKDERTLSVHCALKGTFDGITVLYTADTSVVMEGTGTTLFAMYRYRQRVMELLHEVTTYLGGQRTPYNTTNAIYTQMETEEDREEEGEEEKSRSLGPFDTKTRLKRNLKSLFTEIKEFLGVTTDPMDQLFLQKLCDDVYVCYRTFDTAQGAMYCNSRLSSQGIQRQYAASVPEPSDLMDPTNMDPTNMNVTITDYDDDDETTAGEEFVHTFTNANPYSTQLATEVMRFVSSQE